MTGLSIRDCLEIKRCKAVGLSARESLLRLMPSQADDDRCHALRSTVASPGGALVSDSALQRVDARPHFGRSQRVAALASIAVLLPLTTILSSPLLLFPLIMLPSSPLAVRAEAPHPMFPPDPLSFPSAHRKRPASSSASPPAAARKRVASSTLLFKDRLLGRKPAAAAPSFSSKVHLVGKTKVTDGYLSPATSSPAREPLGEAAGSSSPVRGVAVRSSSTVGLASSSPVRSLGLAKALVSSSTSPSSLPTTSEILELEFPTETPALLLFGRARVPSSLSPGTAAAQQQQQRPPPPLPSSFQPLTPPNASTHPSHVALPRTAKHASRLHLVLEATSDVLVRVTVLGQNGARVQGKRVRCGEAVWVDRMLGGEVRSGRNVGEGWLRNGGAKGAENVELDFWGCKVRIAWPKMEPKEVAVIVADRESSPLSEHGADNDELELDDDDEIVPETQQSIIAVDEDEDVYDYYNGDVSISPSSSRIGAQDNDEEDNDDEEMLDAGVPVTPSKKVKTHRFSSLPPSSPPVPLLLDDESDELPSASTSSLKVKAKAQAPSTSSSRRATPSTPSKSTARRRSSAPPTPERPVAASPPSDIDLSSLLASTLVFSHQTSMALPDIIRGVLESQPGLRALAAEGTWCRWAKAEVSKPGAMFGKVVRRGKVCRSLFRLWCMRASVD